MLDITEIRFKKIEKGSFVEQRKKIIRKRTSLPTDTRLQRFSIITKECSTLCGISEIE